MPTPSTRTPLRVARGTYANLNSSVADIQEGEICYATDQDTIYVKEGSSLVSTGMTGADIKTAYEAEADTNAFTDAEKTKLTGIETGATADQTGAEIKTAYEAEADTNAFTDAEKTKLTGVETGATADQTGAEIKTAYEAEADTNAFTDADHTKLDGIAAGATVGAEGITTTVGPTNTVATATLPTTTSVTVESGHIGNTYFSTSGTSPIKLEIYPNYNGQMAGGYTPNAAWNTWGNALIALTSGTMTVAGWTGPAIPSITTPDASAGQAVLYDQTGSTYDPGVIRIYVAYDATFAAYVNDYSHYPAQEPEYQAGDQFSVSSGPTIWTVTSGKAADLTYADVKVNNVTYATSDIALSNGDLTATYSGSVYDATLTAGDTIDQSHHVALSGPTTSVDFATSTLAAGATTITGTLTATTVSSSNFTGPNGVFDVSIPRSVQSTSNNLIGDIDLEQGNNQIFGGQNSGTAITTVNFRWNGSTTLASKLPNENDMMEVDVILTPNGKDYINTVQVDGATQSVEWVGCHQPKSTGTWNNSTDKELYRFKIINALYGNWYVYATYVRWDQLITTLVHTAGSPISVDYGSAVNFDLQLTQNNSMTLFANAQPGQTGSIIIRQDGTGGRTLSWHSSYKWAGGVAPTLSTAAYAKDRVDYIIRNAFEIQAVFTANYS